MIDILVYTLGTGSGDIDVAVTSGMSDQRMADPGHPHEWKRRELIQYLPKCTEAHARRLHDMAWLPLFDGFYLDSQHGRLAAPRRRRDAVEERLLPVAAHQVAPGVHVRGRGGQGVVPLARPDLRRGAGLQAGTRGRRPDRPHGGRGPSLGV